MKWKFGSRIDRMGVDEGNNLLCLEKNLNASRPSEHPPVRGGGMPKRSGGIIGYKDLPLHGIKSGSPMVVTLLGHQQYNVGEKPTVCRLTLIAMQGHQKSCFSHSAYWLPTRKKLLYTVANPARGLLNREKEKKGKSGSAPPPTLLVRRKKYIKITRRIS